MRVFDLHCDTIGECLNRSQHLRDNTLHLSLSRMSGFDTWVQLYAIWMPDELRGEAAWDYYEKAYDCYTRELALNCDRLLPITTADDLERTMHEGKLGAILTIEGGSVLQGKLETIDTLASQGVKLLTLTWNSANEIAGGVLEGSGFTAFGREAIARLRERGIAVDVSHLSDKGFDELLTFYDGPFVASHSNARALCSHPRNLRDDQFVEIARRGGLVGINYAVQFLNNEPDKASFADILRHIEHFLALGGEDAIALGSDFDGTDVPPELSTCDKIADLYTYLCQHGLPGNICNKVLWGNAYAYFMRNL